MSQPEIMTVPVISTAHVSMHTRDLLDARILQAHYVAWGEYGWVFTINEDPVDDVGLPPDLQGIYHWARKEGYDYVRLDCDAEELTVLPAYDW